MDAHRFDAIAKVLVTETSRRRPLAALLGGTLAVLGLANPDDGLAANGKCKPKCGTCQQCKKGKCKKTKRGKTCKKGKCQPKPNGTACGECRTCQQGACQTVDNGTACGEDRSCQAGVCEANPGCGTGGPCRVFVTSSAHTGNLGGLSGADAICQGLAEAEQLPGSYKAWLSTYTGGPSGVSESPSTRFTNTDKTGPYILVDGTQIATNWADLTDETLAAPIGLTEGGVRVDRSAVWTNTRATGRLYSGELRDNCANWSDGEGHSGFVGDTTLVYNGNWTLFNGNLHCFNLNRLYCFQQG